MKRNAITPLLDETQPQWHVAGVTQGLSAHDEVNFGWATPEKRRQSERCAAEHEWCGRFRPSGEQRSQPVSVGYKHRFQDKHVATYVVYTTCANTTMHTTRWA